MAFLVARIIFAGALSETFSLKRYLLGSLVKNTHVVLYVLRLEYAKSIQLPSPSRLLSLEDTRRFSIPR